MPSGAETEITATEISATGEFAVAAAQAGAALAEGAARSFFLAPWWWCTMLAAGVPPGARPHFLLHDGCLLPLWQGPGARLESLAGPYTCVFQPLFPAATTAAAIRRHGAALAQPLRRAGVVQLDAIDGEASWVAPFLAGLRDGGLHPLRFDHFGNWHEPLAGRGWDAYLAARSGALRETIRRKGRQTSGIQTGGVAFERVTGGPGLEAAIAGYEDVYARSWKVAEPFPRFNAEMMRAAAGAGALRLGLLRAGATVIAAQIWIVANGSAMVVKLAHDEAFRKLSPGTVLTARMVRHMIEDDHAEELDFGRGDDPYKELWTTQRRQRVGFVLANPWRPAGALAIARHLAGRLRRGFGPRGFGQ
jgi:hypothetical protein